MNDRSDGVVWIQLSVSVLYVAMMEPGNDTAAGVVDAATPSSLMEADDFQLRAVESDESL